jgi:hypothetical protein
MGTVNLLISCLLFNVLNILLLTHLMNFWGQNSLGINVDVEVVAKSGTNERDELYC